jgi:hypothetical protein
MSQDYIFSDTLDGIIFNTTFSPDFTISLLGDLLGLSAKPQDSYLYSSLGKDNENMLDFQGETLSHRLGLSAQFHSLRLATFYLLYGSTSKGGADKAQNGLNDYNQKDNDFLFLHCAAFQHKLNYVAIDLLFSYSLGRDFQFEKTVKYQGFAILLSSQLNLQPISLDLTLSYFSPDYCGFKAISMGGLLLYEQKGYFASRFADAYGFKDHNRFSSGFYHDQTLSKSFLQFKITALFTAFRIEYTQLLLYETLNTTQFNLMGSENTIELEFEMDNLKFIQRFAVFVPSLYYENYNDKSKISASGSDLMWGLDLSVQFYLNFFTRQNP